MHNKTKFLIVIILLLFAIAGVFALPKAKYVGTNFISQLKLPNIIADWHGEDVTANLNITYGDNNYLFINKALAYNYENKDKGTLIFILLDAGNFHYPKVCLTGAGFNVSELKKTELDASGRIIKVYTLYIEKARENKNFLILYWIVIDKKFIPNWAEQKIKQLFFSLFNKKRVGLMVRLDIPIKKDRADDGLILAKQFINDLSQKLPPEQADYIFGKK